MLGIEKSHHLQLKGTKGFMQMVALSEQRRKIFEDKEGRI